MQANYSDETLTGHIVGRDYCVEERIGKGGMAWIYRASHRHLGGEVAIKILFSQLIQDVELHTRFVREAQSQYALNHPHIVRVLDFIDDDGLVGFVLEWCNGGELIEWMPAPGIEAVRAIRPLLFPILDAVEYAHSEGIIHRDLKPHNILIQERHGVITPKVTDFGIAKFVQQQGRLTHPGMMVGTLHYMPPEQVRGYLELDHRCDVYSLGVILYQMLAGHLPFVGESMPLIMKILEQAPPTLDSDIPSDVADVVMRCLAKSPDDRFPTVLDLKHALAEALSSVKDTEHLIRYPIEQVRTTEEEGVRNSLLEDTPEFAGTLPVDALPSEERRVSELPFQPDIQIGPSREKDAQRGEDARHSVVRAIPQGLAHPEPHQEGKGPWGIRIWSILFVFFCGVGAMGYIIYHSYDLDLKTWFSRIELGLSGKGGPHVVKVSNRRRTTSRLPSVRRSIQHRRPPHLRGRLLQPTQKRSTTPSCEGPKEAYMCGIRVLKSMSQTRHHERRFVHARTLFIRACEMHHGQACIRAGLLFHTGWSKKRDDLKARVYFRMACEAKTPEGCVQWGHLLRKGFGGLRDVSKAALLYRQACNAGSKVGCKWTLHALQEGWFGSIACPRSVDVFQKACHSSNHASVCSSRCTQ